MLASETDLVNVTILPYTPPPPPPPLPPLPPVPYPTPRIPNHASYHYNVGDDDDSAALIGYIYGPILGGPFALLFVRHVILSWQSLQ